MYSRTPNDNEFGCISSAIVPASSSCVGKLDGYCVLSKDRLGRQSSASVEVAGIGEADIEDAGIEEADIEEVDIEDTCVCNDI